MGIFILLFFILLVLHLIFLTHQKITILLFWHFMWLTLCDIPILLLYMSYGLHLGATSPYRILLSPNSFPAVFTLSYMCNLQNFSSAVCTLQVIWIKIRGSFVMLISWSTWASHDLCLRMLNRWYIICRHFERSRRIPRSYDHIRCNWRQMYSIELPVFCLIKFHQADLRYTDPT